MALSVSKDLGDSRFEYNINGYDLGHIEEDVALDARKFRYGSLSSQYGELDDATIAQIEEAAMCCHLRDFQAAVSTFDSFSLELRRHPAVAYEYSQVYWLDWSLYKCENVLESAIAWARENAPDFDKSGVYTLLRIALGRTKVFTNGTCLEARDAMREIKSWLSGTPIKDYTDVQTYCVCNYYFTLRYIKEEVTNNFDAEFFRIIPYTTGTGELARLMHLRGYLQDEGRLREARAILDIELGHSSDGTEQQKACRSLLQACDNWRHSEEPIWWITGRVKARLGQITSVCGLPEASREDFHYARRVLQTARAVGKENNTLLLVRLAEIAVSTTFRQEDTLELYEEFAGLDIVQKDSYVYHTALTRACEIAATILEADASPPNRASFWEWNTKAELMLKKLGDIAFLYNFRQTNGNIACWLFGDFGGILKWYEQFETEYPSFQLWSPKTNARRTKLMIYNGLKDEKGIFLMIKQMKEIVADQDKFWSDQGFKLQEEISGLSGNREVDNNSIPAAFQSGAKEIERLTAWSREMPVGFATAWNELGVDVGSDSVVHFTLLEEHLCSWLKQDLQTGILTEQDLKLILSSDSFEDADFPKLTRDLKKCQIREGEEDGYGEGNIDSSDERSTDHYEDNMPSKLDGQIDALTPASVSLGLYGTYASPTSESRWEKAFVTLSDWLLWKSKQHDIDRQFLLYNIQNRRLRTVVSSAASYKTRCLEAQRLINLVAKLSADVQDQVSPNISSWRSIVAGAKHMMYIESHGHLLLDMSCPELEEIIGLYDQCLAENRGNRGSQRLVRELHTHMDIAIIYFYAAAKLDPKAMDGFFNAMDGAVEDFEKIREGWRALTGWDKVEKLLQALEDRRIPQIAPMTISILCQFPNDKRDLRDKMIWSLLQFAKSIGIGWLMKSNASSLQDDRRDDKASDECSNNGLNAPQDDGKRINASGGDDSTRLDARHDVEESLESSDRQKNTNNTDDQAGVEAASAFSTEQMEAELQAINRLGGNAVFIDWHKNASGLADTPRPIIATLEAGVEGPKCCLASISWQEVDNIVERFMDLETEELQSRKATKFLYKLNPLVEPLSWTKPGQTLVFSPCGNLHRVPLHALKINGEVVIKRNPVVYCSSFTALVVAFKMRQNMERRLPGSITPNALCDRTAHPTDPSTKVDSSRRVSLFGDPPSELGKKALENTAARFKAKPNIGVAFNASSFTDTIQNPNLHLLHYHGHANFTSTAPMDQSLLFYDRALTLRDIFDLPPSQGGFHATLLGCGSGMSKTVPTNDVLGLVPSLLHVGASSAVSTLWKFSDADAAQYSESFYGEFEDAKERGSDEIVDLARANQKAVLKIMEAKPGLYHWGAFVLNGYWLFKTAGISGGKDHVG